MALVDWKRVCRGKRQRKFGKPYLCHVRYGEVGEEVAKR